MYLKFVIKSFLEGKPLVRAENVQRSDVMIKNIITGAINRKRS